MDRNIATVQEIYAAFARGDVGAILGRLDADVDWEHDWGVPPLALYAPRRGRAEVPGFFAELAAFEFRRFEPLDVLASATRVAVPVAIELVVRANGRTVRDLESHWWTFGPDGLVTRFRHMADTRQFAAALGV